MEHKKKQSTTIKKSESAAQIRNNRTRTNLLVMAASDFDRGLKLSKLMINSINPKDIAKKYEVVVRMENPFYFDSSTVNFSHSPHLLNSRKLIDCNNKVKCVLPVKRYFHSEKQGKEIEIKKKASQSNNMQLSGLLDNLTCHDFLSFIREYNINLKKRSQLLENINYKRINIAKRKFEHNKVTFKSLNEKDIQQPVKQEVKVLRKVSCLKSNLNKTQFQFKRSITNQQNCCADSLNSQRMFVDLLKKSREQRMSKAIRFIFLSKEERNIKLIQGNYNYLQRLSDFLKFDKKLDKSDLYKTEMPKDLSKDAILSNLKLKIDSKNKDLLFPTELFEILEFKGISFEGITNNQTQCIKPSATLVFCSDDPGATCLVDFQKQSQLTDFIDTLSRKGSILESPLIKQYAKRSDIHFNIKIESKTSVKFDQSDKTSLTQRFPARDFKTTKNLSNVEEIKCTNQSKHKDNKLTFASSQSDNNE